VHLVCTGDDGRTQLDLGRSLAARGIRLAELRDGATTVRCSCLENLREYACIADIGEGAARRVVTATRAKDSGGRSVPKPIVALQLRPLHAQRDPILDVTMAGASLLVLTPTTVTRIPLPGQPAVAPQSAAVTTGRVWPRDLRGHLRADGDAFQVFLPGVTCRGTSTLFALACADEGESWPIGIENAGMAASRNTFATPEGFSFYEAAPLDGGQWLVVDQQGTLTFLDAQAPGGCPRRCHRSRRGVAERLRARLVCRHRATLSGRGRRRRAAPGPCRGRFAGTGSLDDRLAWRSDRVVVGAGAVAPAGGSRGGRRGARCSDRTL
jgi:hypothetical protein